MSKKSNPTLIGAFVVGAVVLLGAGVALFGGSELLAERNIYVAYFSENTKGLRVGSNVVVNGVRVGHVSNIALLVDSETFEFKTETTLEILADSYVLTRGDMTIGKGLIIPPSRGQAIDEAGLRATLDVESFVTGQLLVELVLRPDTEAVRRGGIDAPYPEIPTIPSRSQEILGKVQTTIVKLGDAFDIELIGERVENILKGLDELSNSQDLRDSLAGLSSIINQQDTQELTATLRATLDEIRRAAGDASTLLQNADNKMDTLRPAIERLAGVLDEAQATLASARLAFQGESAEIYQLGTTLHEVERAARALREFLDYLERNPEALLRGKE